MFIILRAMWLLIICQQAFSPGLLADAKEPDLHTPGLKLRDIRAPEGVLLRPEAPGIEAGLKASGVIITAILVPTFTFLGALLVNPRWSMLGELQGSRAKISYIDHTMHAYTIPLAAIFAFLGTAPLWGIFLAERGS